MRQDILLIGHKDSAKNDPELGKNDLTNLENLVELLWYRVEGGDISFENHVQNTP